MAEGTAPVTHAFLHLLADRPGAAVMKHGLIATLISAMLIVGATATGASMAGPFAMLAAAPGIAGIGA